MNKNITFQWKGIHKSGDTISGSIQAQNLTSARSELRKQDIIIRSIIKKRQPLYEQYKFRIKATDINLFTRQLATLIKAGIPLIHAVGILGNGTENKRMKTLIETIKRDVSGGLMLAQALSNHPEYFNALFCGMVNAGEQSGSLEIILQKLASYKEKMALIKKKNKQGTGLSSSSHLACHVDNHRTNDVCYSTI